MSTLNPSIVNENIISVFSDLDIVFSLLQRDYVINAGKNLTIPCGDISSQSIWTRDGNNITNNYNVIIVSDSYRCQVPRYLKNFLNFINYQEDTFLMLLDVTSDDAGLYTCSVLQNTSDTESYHDYVRAYVRVRTKPGDNES